MAQTVLLKAQGLYTFPNRLSSVPAGALTKAKNIVINRDNIIESRRGFKLYGTAMASGVANMAHQLLAYKGRILRHYGAGSGTTLEYDSGTTDGSGTEVFNAFTGTYAEVIQGLRIKSIEANSNFYFTTSTGIKKLSCNTAADLATTNPTNSGGIKALDLQVSLNPQTGFFNEESVVAYRLVWGIKDANSNLVLGTPSSRAVIYNPLTYLLVSDFDKLLTSLDTPKRNHRHQCSELHVNV